MLPSIYVFISYKIGISKKSNYDQNHTKELTLIMDKGEDVVITYIGKNMGKEIKYSLTVDIMSFVMLQKSFRVLFISTLEFYIRLSFISYKKYEN